MAFEKVYINVEETFGKLKFLSKTGDVFGDRTNRRRATQHRYMLESEKMPVEQVEVEIPASAGLKDFDFGAEVVLVNPYLTAVGQKIGTGNRATAFSAYMLHADNLTKV